MKELIVDGLNALSNVSPATWEVLGTAIVASGVLSPLLMGVKKLFKIKRELIMLFTVIAASFAVAAVAYLKDVVEYNPVVIGLILTVGTNIAYHAVFKPLSKKYAPKLAQMVENARLYKSQKKAAKATVEPEVETPGRLVV